MAYLSSTDEKLLVDCMSVKQVFCHVCAPKANSPNHVSTDMSCMIRVCTCNSYQNSTCQRWLSQVAWLELHARAHHQRQSVLSVSGFKSDLVGSLWRLVWFLSGKTRCEQAAHGTRSCLAHCFISACSATLWHCLQSSLHVSLKHQTTFTHVALTDTWLNCLEYLVTHVTLTDTELNCLEYPLTHVALTDTKLKCLVYLFMQRSSMHIGSQLYWKVCFMPAQHASYQEALIGLWSLKASVVNLC